MNFLGSRRGKAGVGIVLVLALFLVRPGAQSLRARIVRSISLALGRQVDVGSVTLRLLPQPGFELENFVVHEDPAFGAEPVLQSSDVVALVRVGSLLRGQLEIARLSLAEPSLNLVRDREGHWNLENLLERAARTPIAPTGKTRNETRPGFPYIEANHGRINFKVGQEKKPYTLIEANFTLWQDSENAWGVRLHAQPMRTDFNLSDTGSLELEGSWQRAASLHETPLQFTAQWEGAQLGQVTKLALGQDKGWRGSVGFSASLAGTPADLIVTADASVQDFRRYDIAGYREFHLSSQCRGHYNSTDHLLSGLTCRSPVGDGGISVKGSVVLRSPVQAYDLTVLAENIPVQPLVEFARRAKKNVAADLVAAGRLDGQATLRRDPAGKGAVWQGGGAVTAVSLRSPFNNTRLAVDRIPFRISPAGALEPGSTTERRNARLAEVAFQPRLEVGPLSLGLGKPVNTTVNGQFSRSGYSLAVQGEAEVQKLLDAGRTAGLSTPPLAASGGARVNLHVGGSWANFAPPVVTGTALLNSVHARLRGLTDPVELTSASLSLTPDSTEVHKLTLVAAGSTWRGGLTIPRRCSTPQACPIRFDLHADEIASSTLGIVGASGKQPWYRFLSSPRQPPVSLPRPYLASVHAVGRLSAGRVLIHHLIARGVSADVELEQGRLRLASLHGEIMGGHHSGEWTADFTANPPAYRGHGSVENIALVQLAEAMHDGWVTGSASIEYTANTLGWSKAELLSGAAVTLQVEARDGSLPHLSLAGEGDPLRVNQFMGRLRLHGREFEIEEGKLQTPASIYQISGTASLDRVLDLKLSREGARGFNVTGTLTQPHVVMQSTSETQAALKP